MKFRKIPSLKFLYEISDNGVLRNIKSKKVLLPSIDKYGYKRYTLHQKCFGEIKKFEHQLVMEVWGEPKPEWASSIDHIDRNRKNNSITNLRWANPTIQAQNRDNLYLKNPNRTQSLDSAIEANRKKIILVDSNIIFDSCREAAEYIKENMKLESSIKTIANHIGECASGKRKVAYKNTWKFY